MKRSFGCEVGAKEPNGSANRYEDGAIRRCLEGTRLRQTGLRGDAHSIDEKA